jgi:hypothetical protein
MNTKGKSSIKESKMKITASNIIHLAGVSAIVAGLCYIAVGLFHPLNVLASVTTARWAMVHALATAMGFFGLLGLAGIYARQVKESGWLGLIGFILLSLWLVITTGFTFAETFILPLLATTAPTFVEGFLGSFSGAASAINMGVLPTLWTLTGPLYILGGLLFGIATIRAGILPRWAAGLLAIGVALAPVAALLPAKYEPLVAVPVGLALAWLGYALFSERREPAAEPVTGSVSPVLRATGAD